ncbi:MAG: hypothetical protein H7Z19_05480 [Chitinophagaceae bacterium]|nr:hypothetical protein [Rubrivivax sp.]
MRSTALAAAISLIAASVPAAAQLIVGNDQSGTATIYNINVGTGVATPIYSGTGPEAKPWGMAYDVAGNMLYWSNANNLFSSPLGPSLTPTNLGTMSFGGSGVNFVGLSFANGRLYGTRNIATEAVYEIDPTTRVATQVYVHPSTYDFGGIDHDAASGRLYGLSDTGGTGLYEINTAAQTVTLRAPYPGGENDIDGLAVYNGRAYYVTDGPNTTQASFYVYDVASGLPMGTLPSPFTGSGTFSAATFAAPIPEPAPTVLALMGGAVLAFSRRLRARRMLTT